MWDRLLLPVHLYIHHNVDESDQYVGITLLQEYHVWLQNLAPDSLSNDPETSLRHSCDCIKETDNWSPNQQMGRRWTLGCVALEITQRCNLDCSLCYLSEHSEAIRDIPVEELFRRIDLIHQHYGAYTNVQVWLQNVPRDNKGCSPDYIVA